MELNPSVAGLSNPLSSCGFSTAAKKSTRKLSAVRKGAAFHSVLGKDLEDFTLIGDSVAPASKMTHEQSYFA